VTEAPSESDPNAILAGPQRLGIFPLRNTVVYPYMPQQLTATRERSIAVIEEAMEGERVIGIFAQRNSEVEVPAKEDLYSIGCIGKIHKLWRMPDGGVRLIVQGVERGILGALFDEGKVITGEIDRLQDQGSTDAMEVQAMTRSIRNQFQAIIKITSHLPDELQILVMNIDHPGRLADFVASNLDLPIEEHQRLLESLDIQKRLAYLTELITRELEILETGAKIQSQVQEKLGKSQREYFLREQLKTIQKELSGDDPVVAEMEELRAKIEAAQLPEEVAEVASRELGRLDKMMPGAPEYSVVRTYLDWLTDLPWATSTDDRLDVAAASAILDEDHFGLDKVKERILEYLAVRQLRKEIKGPLLCFVGPPGVGKTSLGRSIARSLGRNFVRISLGGVRDEAEIRGHRRTYIGSLPGRIIQGLHKAGSNNPVFMLDEIDKLGMDFRGDPGAALLEVLDPEQNFSFVDHYLDVPFDLSQVMFIATANLLAPIPAPLLDRMEEIALPGYTPNEKEQIARTFLVPRQLEEHGLKGSQLAFEDGSLPLIVEQYTREAGLRTLERQIGSVCRKVARKFVEGRKRKIRVLANDLEQFLGAAIFFPEVADAAGEVGVATGMAATATGGEILFIEATKMQGRKNLILTGQLGEVMQESAQAALSYMRTRAGKFRIEAKAIAESDIHVHVPSGATPKDGPSAGVAITAALVSLFTGRRVRGDIAMTGEITLRGRVLPVGGIRDKVLGAQRAGIRTVILPRKNEKDLEEIPDPIRKQMNFQMVENIDEALDLALGKKAARKQARPKAAKKKMPARKSKSPK
jgi:ATP-dependent Lon protease